MQLKRIIIIIIIMRTSYCHDVCIIIMCNDIRRIESHAIVYHDECTTAAAVRYLQNFAFIVASHARVGTSSCRTTTLSLLLLLYAAVCVYTSRI